MLHSITWQYRVPGEQGFIRADQFEIRDGDGWRLISRTEVDALAARLGMNKEQLLALDTTAPEWLVDIETEAGELSREFGIPVSRLPEIRALGEEAMVELQAAMPSRGNGDYHFNYRGESDPARTRVFYQAIKRFAPDFAETYDICNVLVRDDGDGIIERGEYKEDKRYASELRHYGLTANDLEGLSIEGAGKLIEALRLVRNANYSYNDASAGQTYNLYAQNIELLQPRAVRVLFERVIESTDWGREASMKGRMATARLAD